MDAVRTFLESQSLFALFLTIALGYLIGEITIKGVALGSGAVLFVGLAIGAFAPKSAPPALLGTLGLLLFLYGIGIQYGAQFFRGLTSREGAKANAAACLGVIAAGLVSCAFIRFGITLADALGMFAGSGTSTASLQVAIASMKSNDAAVGYSVAYPFGVAGPILFLYALNVLLKVSIPKPPAKVLETAEIALKNASFFGLRLSELLSRLPLGVSIAAVRRAHRNQLPADDFIVQSDDVLLVTATDKRLLDEATALCGESQPGRIASDREDIDYMRVFASNSAVVGMPLGKLRFPGGVNCSIAHVRRGDADLLSTPDLILEAGDRVGVLVNRAHRATIRAFFGDSIKGTADLSFICLGIGAAAGAAARGRSVAVSRPRQLQPRSRCVAAARAVPWQSKAQRTVRVGHAAIGESGSAQSRAHDLSCAGRNFMRAEVRGDRGHSGAAAASLWRDHAARARGRNGRVVPMAIQAALRYLGRRRMRRDR